MLTYATVLFILLSMPAQKEIHLLLHNIRSSYNVGSLFRTADGLGVNKLHLTGYTPYPQHPKDTRLPHVRLKTNKAIHKTALGAETTVPWEYYPDIESAIAVLRKLSIKIIALEQSSNSILLENYKPQHTFCIVLGSERDGLDKSALELCDDIVEIPMRGEKESFNVSVAGAIALHFFSQS